MSEVSIEKLASDIKTPLDRLVQQFKDAGLDKKPGDNVTEGEKKQLLDHLSKAHGNSGEVAPQKMTLKRKTTSTLSVGKSKNVKVEVRKKRTFVKRSPEEEQRLAAEEAARQAAEQAKLEAEQKAAQEAKALAEAKAREAEEAKRKVAQEAAARAEQAKKEAEERRKNEPQMTAEEKAAQEAARKEEERLRKKQEEEAQRKLEEDAKKAAEAARKLAVENERRWKEEEERRKAQEAEEVHVHSNRYAQEAEDQEDAQIEQRGSRRRKRNKKAADGLKQGFNKPAAPVERIVKLGETITVGELASKLAIKANEVIKTMMKMGEMATINQVLDQDTAVLVVEEMGHKFELVNDNALEDELIADTSDGEKASRAPVVTIMGHVDHGKTSLLDAIRQANVVSGEAGGITQHIGAYQVTAPDGSLLSFLDTPGHAAFTSMRARGAQVTDIVVLVVAADDSVMPQTIEAINHAKAAKVPMIVAINKCDKPDANPDIVRTELLQHEVIVEAMSGDVQDVEVSALAKTGLDQLLEAISLQAEILELKANPKRAAQGAVIEAQLDVGRGPVATVLVQKGTLKQGDIFVVGEQWGKVRALINDKGERVKEAGPSVPVEVLGLNGAPEAGDVLNVVDTEAQAREIADYRIDLAKEKRAAAGAATTLEQLMARAKENENLTEMPILVKADVQGSAEAIVQAMEKIGNDEVRVRVLHYGVGAITDTDVGLAEASGAPVIGFNVRANASARNSANQKGVEIRYYSIIYDLVDDVRAAASGLLSAEIRENFIGYAQIKEVFKVSGVGKVAGCIVTEGVARRSAGVRLLRDNVVIHEGTLKTLKRFKDEVKDVQSGQECGMAFENYDDIRPNDVIEIFEREEVARTLD